MNERREFTRVSRPIDVDIDMAPGQRIEGRARELSLKGLFVASDATFAAGAAVRCTLYIDGRNGVTRAAATGSVVRNASEGMAIEFHEIEGLESLEHLRRLLLLNAGDELEQVEREFATHWGLKPC